MLQYYRFFGGAGVVCGLICAAGLLLPGMTGVTVSVIAMLPGFLFSSLYIMLTTRHELETPKINPGYLGLLLSSAPVLVIIFALLFN